MGTYLNPGKESYQMAVNSEIFVDKTEMIQYLNSVVNTRRIPSMRTALSTTAMFPTTGIRETLGGEILRRQSHSSA